MNRKIWLVALALLVPVAGGARESFLKDSYTSSKKELLKRLETLEKQNAELQRQVAELNTKLAVLTQRVNASCPGPAAAASGGSGVAFSSPNPPPAVPELEVVRVRPETPPAALPSRPKGKLIITNSNSEAPVLIERGAPLPGTNYVPLPDPETTLSASGPSEPASSGSAAPSSPGLASPAGASPAASPAASNLSAAESFKAIKELVEQGKLDEAAPLMEDYLKEHPAAGGEAQVAFWLGTYYMDQQKWEDALSAFKLISDKHFQSEVAAEALFKTARCHLEMGNTDKARTALQDLKLLYPFSEWADKAEKLLKSCCP